MIRTLLGIGLAICIPFLSVQAQQNTTLSHRFQQTSLAEALSFIEQHFDRQFIYDPTLINRVKIGKLTFQDASIDEVLSRLLPAAQLEYKPMDERYILIKSITGEPPSFEQPSEQAIDKGSTICGQLVDAESGLPLSFATVYLKNSKRGTLTDEAGNFELKGRIQQGDTIVMQYLGYAPKLINTTQLIDQPCQTQALQLQDFKIADVIVEEDAITLMEGAEDGKGAKFRPGKLDVLPGWGDNDLLRIVQLLPGVHSSDESATNIHIRGGTPDQNLILLDGIPVYHTGHFFGMFSAFNPDIVDEMEVFKGDFGARYGDRVSGVINIRSKPDNLDSTNIVAGLNLINAYAQIQAPIVPGKVALLVAARRSFSDLVQSATYNNLFNQLAGRGKIQDNQQAQEEEEEEDIDFILSPLLNFSDINAKLQFQPFAQGGGAISYYQGADRLSYGVLFDEEAFYFNSDDNIRLKNWGLSGEWTQQIGKSYELFAQAVVNEYSNAYEYRHTFERVNLDEDYDYVYFQDNTLVDLTFRLQNSWQLNQRLALNFGWEYNDREVVLDIRDDVGDDDVEEEPFTDVQEGKNTVFYLDFDYKLPNSLAINLGIRSSYYSGTEQSFLEPRFSLDWQPSSENLHLKMSAGRQVQTLSQAIQNNDLGFGERIWLIADGESDIPVITGTQFSGGAWWKKNGYLIDIEWYS
ncbi:MAG: TonB-dependent receptor, partial [Bacteroidota bacterium]